ncbi:hypothetical protein [Symbioplanes lichenis]|uniref:hypothetical protein n=1 Tax=Symbioplanes lichenis TaxID=1629072 RepID=UPI002738ED2F|nr:hypothetical protein [Actinoplanes lichenis]
MSDVRHLSMDAASASARANSQPWELGRRYMRGELDAAAFLDQSSRALPVRLDLARAISAFIGLFVAISYAVLAVYLLWESRPTPAAFSLGGAVAVTAVSVTRWRRTR